eukprot:5761655-Prymnesium_polylepis.1
MMRPGAVSGATRALRSSTRTVCCSKVGRASLRSHLITAVHPAHCKGGRPPTAVASQGRSNNERAIGREPAPMLGSNAASCCLISHAHPVRMFHARLSCPYS